MIRCCPSCGYNLVAEVPLIAGRFQYAPSTGFLVDGARLKMAPQCHIMIGALMLAGGKVVRGVALAIRAGWEVTDARCTANVLAMRIRRALIEAEVEPLIATVPAVGYRWIGPPVRRIDEG